MPAPGDPSRSAGMMPSIRLARPGDEAAVASLIEAMDRHYVGGTEDPGRIRDAVAGWLLGDDADAGIALAFDDGRPVAMAIFAILVPGVALSRLMFLKDIFVIDQARGRGIGESMMRFLATYCVDNEIGRIDLETERDNDGARKFFDRLGADCMDWKVAYRFGPEALARLAK